MRQRVRAYATSSTPGPTAPTFAPTFAPAVALSAHRRLFSPLTAACESGRRGGGRCRWTPAGARCSAPRCASCRTRRSTPARARRARWRPCGSGRARWTHLRPRREEAWPSGSQQGWRGCSNRLSPPPLPPPLLSTRLANQLRPRNRVRSLPLPPLLLPLLQLPHPRSAGCCRARTRSQGGTCWGYKGGDWPGSWLPCISPPSPWVASSLARMLSARFAAAWRRAARAC
jgi:hypothetical protein